MTAIEATNPKRNQSKTGDADGGAAPPEAAQRRRRSSSRSAAVAGRSACSSRNQNAMHERDDRRESHRSGRASPPAGSTPSRRWRSGAHRVSSSPCGVGACGSRSAPAGCRDRRQEQRQAPRRRSRGGDDPLPSPATQGEAALVIPTIAASRKLTTTTAATGSRPHSGRASPSITHSLRCSLIADLRRYATEPLAAAPELSAAETASPDHC